MIFFYKKIFRSCTCLIRRGEGAFSSDQGEINTEVQIFFLVFFFQKLPTKGGRYGSRVPTHLSSGARPTGSPNPPKSTPPWKGAGPRIFQIQVSYLPEGFNFLSKLCSFAIVIYLHLMFCWIDC